MWLVCNNVKLFAALEVQTRLSSKKVLRALYCEYLQSIFINHVIVFIENIKSFVLCFIDLLYIFIILFYFRVLCRIYSIPESRHIFLVNFHRRKVFQVPFVFDCIAKRFYYFLIMLTAKVIFSACCLQYGKCVVWALWFKHNPANC